MLHNFSFELIYYYFTVYILYNLTVSGLPSAWNAQNIAALLLNCGDHIIQKVLISKAINNRFHEVVCIAHHLYVVSNVQVREKFIRHTEVETKSTFLGCRSVSRLIKPSKEHRSVYGILSAILSQMIEYLWSQSYYRA